MITANLTVLSLHSFRNYDRNLTLNKRGKLPFDRRKKHRISCFFIPVPREMLILFDYCAPKTIKNVIACNQHVTR